MRVNKLVLRRDGKTHRVLVETSGVTGKRLRVNMGTLDKLADLEKLVTDARAAPGLAQLYALRGGM